MIVRDNGTGVTSHAAFWCGHMTAGLMEFAGPMPHQRVALTALKALRALSIPGPPVVPSPAAC